MRIPAYFHSCCISRPDSWIPLLILGKAVALSPEIPLSGFWFSSASFFHFMRAWGHMGNVRLSPMSKDLGFGMTWGTQGLGCEVPGLMLERQLLAGVELQICSPKH